MLSKAMLLLIVLFSFVLHSFAIDKSSDPQNANHIFNAIHSSMRQWGSSLNHNGMSFFMATVPAGIQLYHGTGSPEPIQGIEWLAFEPEHALVFARPEDSRPGGPPGEHPPPPFNKEEWEKVMGYAASEGLEGNGRSWPPPPPPPGAHHEEPLPLPHRGPPPPRPPPPPGSHNRGKPPSLPHDLSPPPIGHQQRLQIPTPPSPSKPKPSKPGYLHTYVPKHPLHLLYIDGMSAGKTVNGTLDTQDYILVNVSESDRGGMFQERQRAHTLCNHSATVWENKIDGVIRMEGGFEIILCDFERDLEVRDIMPVRWSLTGPDRSRGLLGGWRYYQAITDRYHGIGGSRVTLDYDSFVSVFESAGPELWDNDVQSDVAMPRLQNVPDEDLLKIRDQVTKMILASERDRSGKAQRDGINWQGITDMIVKRYSEPLHYLSSPSSSVRTSKEEFAEYLSMLLRPFVDFTSRNTTRETDRCVSQFLPASIDDSTLASRSVRSIAQRICSTLLLSFDTTTLSLSRSLGGTSPPSAHALAQIDSLVWYLQWTTWKQCPTCNDDEICVIPIWPMGTHEDHRAPKCHGEGDVWGFGKYWGMRLPRPPPDRDDEGREELAVPVNAESREYGVW